MDDSEARAILGVEPDATAAEIQQQFRELARDAHPDTSEDGQGQTNGPSIDRLVAARDALLDDPGRALVPLEALGTIAEQIGRGIERRYEAKERSQAAIREFARHKTSRIRRWKTLSALLGLLAATLALALQVTSSTRQTPVSLLEPASWDPVTGAAFLAAVLYGGLGYLWLRYSIRAIEEAVDELEEVLEDKSWLVEILVQLNLWTFLREPRTAREIEEYLSEEVEEEAPRDLLSPTRIVLAPYAIGLRSVTAHQLVATVGQAHASRIMVAKAIEHELVGETTDTTAAEPSVQYTRAE